jgi:hypothetical protein
MRKKKIVRINNTTNGYKKKEKNMYITCTTINMRNFITISI